MQKNLKSTYAIGIVMGLLLIMHLFLSFPVVYGLAACAILVIYFVLLFASFRKKEPNETLPTRITFLEMSIMTIIAAFLYFDMLYLFVLVMALSFALIYLKIFNIRDFARILLVIFIVYIMASTMLQPAVAISQGQGTVLSDNWWNSLNWIKDNTDECAVIATYWDPGHFITSIAKRAVVFDGASQNNVWNITVDADTSYEEIKKLAGTDNFVTSNITVNGETKVSVETARIQDIATAMMTNNETEAVGILKKFAKPGCNELYFLASADLIGKSYWWTYFSTWNPVDKGCATPISTLSLAQARPSLNGGVSYVFQGGLPAGCNNQVGGQVLINSLNNSIDAYVLNGNTLEPVERFVFYTNEGAYVKTRADASVQGTLILEPNNQQLLFVPHEIQDSMFTSMFLFNGQGLEKFEFVNQWGGEVKLFKVNLTLDDA